MWYGERINKQTNETEQSVETDSCVQTEQRNRTGSPKNWLSQNCHTFTFDVLTFSYDILHMTGSDSAK